MCGIYCSNISDLKNGLLGESLLRSRGPDCLSKINIEQFYLSHSLLSITGDLKLQPFTKKNIVCLYNGEIYNYKDFAPFDAFGDLKDDYESDGECIIDAYISKGSDFVKYLDGEFALVLYDPLNDVLIASTDVFSTKPLYYSLEGKKFGCASYRTPLEESGHTNIKKFKPNTTMVFSTKDFSLLDQYANFVFSLDQHKGDFNDWHDAFSNSIHKRVNNCNKKIFIGLSSGYDSGVICKELIKQNIKFKAYTVLGSEDENITRLRQGLINNSKDGCFENLNKTDSNWQMAHEFIKNNTEHYKYNINAENHPLDYWRGCPLIDDSGSNWLSLVCKHARSEGYKVHLSGMGADEIFSDYGFGGKPYLPHSNFGGLFPEDLNTIFPWDNFYNGSMEAYLTKEEYVGGAHSIETRYPFLDKYVVQEFLNLDKSLKNSKYKSVLYEYLKKENFPFREDQKLGF